MIDGIDNEKILEAIAKNSYNSIVVTDSNLEYPGPKIVYVNKAFTENTGYSLDEIKGKTPRILQGEQTSRKVLDELKEKCQKGEDFADSTINYTKEGSKYHVEWNISPIKNTYGDITHFISIQRNITHEMQTIYTLQRIIDQQKNIIIITDGLKLVYVNQSFKDFFNVKSLEEFLEQDDCICSRFSKVEGFYYQENKDENWIEALQSLTSNNRIVSMEDKNFISHGFFVGIDDYGDNKDIITFTDITESIGEKIDLKYKAYHDQLSGAYNREFIHNKFKYYKEQAIKKSLNIGLAIFDIDHFKHVNDTYGHNVGDKIIQKIVNIALETTRSNDYTVRWGGEEFIILAQVKVLEEIKTIAEHVRVAIEYKDFISVPKITASFGVALSSKDDSLESLVKKADDALYKAKDTGRNKVISL